MYAVGPSKAAGVAAPAASTPAARARPARRTKHPIFSDSESDGDETSGDMSANGTTGTAMKVAARQDIGKEPAAAQMAASESTSKRPQRNEDVMRDNIAAAAAASDKMPAVPVPNAIQTAPSQRPQ